MLWRTIKEFAFVSDRKGVVCVPDRMRCACVPDRVGCTCVPDRRGVHVKRWTLYTLSRKQEIKTMAMSTLSDDCLCFPFHT